MLGAEARCQACRVCRGGAACGAARPGLVPGARRSLPGHPLGGSVQPRSFHSAVYRKCRTRVERWLGETGIGWGSVGWGGGSQTPL